MRRSARLCAAGLLVAAMPPPPVVHEPLLGLRWSAPPARFDPADPALKGRCANLVNDNYDADLYVLARAATPSGDLLIVSGRSHPRRPALADEPDDLGVVLRWRDGVCTMIGPAREPFDDAEDYAPQVSRDELVALAGDAARRYVVAFGGARGLCVAVSKQHVHVAHAPAILVRAFRRAAPCLARS